MSYSNLAEARASSVLNKSHGSRHVFFSTRNPIVFSIDDTDTSCLAGDPLGVTRSIIDRDIARLEERIRALKSRRNEFVSYLSPSY